MKRNNGGYSLVELLLTMAIFSIMMLGIVNIMRSTAVVFNNGSDEINVQTEAQIVVNQISDLLADANVTVVGVTDGYCIKNADKDYYILQNGDTLKYTSVTHGVTLDDSANWSLMAEYVDSFTISGLQCNDEYNTGDNIAQVSLKMDKNDYKYVASKEVYFRNSIENREGWDEFLDENGDPYNGDAPQPQDDPTTELSRYEIIDLQTEYGMESGWGWTDETKCITVFQFCDENGTHSDTPTRYVMCTADVLKDFNKEVPASDNIGVKGLDKDGNAIVKVLHIPKVKFIIGNGILTIANSGANVTPRSIFVETVGYDAYSAKSKFSKDITVDMVMYTDKQANSTDAGYHEYSSDERYKLNQNDNGNANSFFDLPINLYSGNGDQGKDFYFKPDSVNAKMQLGVAAFPAADGFVIYQTNGKLEHNPEYLDTASADGKLRLAVTVHLPSYGNKTLLQTFDINIASTGTTITEKFGGNMYSKVQ